MAFTKFEKDMNIIQKLDDEPNDVGGMTSAELKSKFDEPGNAVKDWINNVFIPEVERELANALLGQIDPAIIAPEKIGAAAADLSNVSDEDMLEKIKDTGFSGGLPATESTDYPGCYYRMVDRAQEWFNPPMQLGVEYRTTERYNGKPVYVKVLDAGQMPNATEKVVYHEIANIAYPLEIALIDSRTGYGVYTTHAWYSNLWFNSSVIYITTTNGNASTHYAYCRLKYTKTTD